MSQEAFDAVQKERLKIQVENLPCSELNELVRVKGELFDEFAKLFQDEFDRRQKAGKTLTDDYRWVEVKNESKQTR